MNIQSKAVLLLLLRRSQICGYDASFSHLNSSHSFEVLEKEHARKEITKSKWNAIKLSKRPCGFLHEGLRTPCSQTDTFLPQITFYHLELEGLFSSDSAPVLVFPLN